MATLTLVCLWLGRNGYLKDLITVEHYHDLGKLMFAFMVFWAYVSFSQYMLIWYANLPEETMWYQHRAQGSWGAIGSVLLFGHFLVPFVFLMSRHVKRNKLLLSIAAVFLLVMHWFSMQFLIMPTEHTEGFAPSWLDLTTMVGLFAVFLAATLANTIRAPLIPERDPRLPESVRFEND